ncbi:uncharacterized protein LOC141679758 [Apium graveolens]|uniref:uncharacterized protein LOC141679758 n=1 Tax=Apium graveolens TaxID=4045 RepID=UPI003D7AAFE8
MIVIHLDSTFDQVSLTNYFPHIEPLSGSNLDYAIRVVKTAAITAERSAEQKADHVKWKYNNRVSLIILKGSITSVICGAISEFDNAKEYLANIEEQFKATTKAQATTLISKMITLKYNCSSGVRDHIMRTNNMDSRLNDMDMKISEGFLIHFILNSIPAQFGPFKFNYNTQKEK